MGIRAWFTRLREVRQLEVERTIQTLLEAYPYDSPIIVRNLLSPCNSVRHATEQYLQRAEARRREDARVRAIVQEELAKHEAKS